MGMCFEARQPGLDHDYSANSFPILGHPVPPAQAAHPAYMRRSRLQLPISKLAPNQVRYHFISGYTAKAAGSGKGVKESVLTDTLSQGI